MTEAVLLHIKKLIDRYPSLVNTQDSICAAYQMLVNCYEHGGKLLIAGNGGSAADAEHMVGELMKSFALERRLGSDLCEKLQAIDPEMGQVLAQNLQGALPAIALNSHTAFTTAYMNDCEPLLCFAQQVNGYGTQDDVFLAISTSGNSQNVLYAAVTAKAKGMPVIGLTGESRSRLSALADVCIRVPGRQTHEIQELHLPVYHTLCLMLEEHFFGE